MAFSFCWRYKCLPDQFSISNFTATISQLDKFNIKRMPGNIVYNATLKVGQDKLLQPQLVVGHLATI